MHSFITTKTIMQILSRSRKLEEIELFKKYRINLHHTRYAQKEQDTLGVNMKVFQTQKIIIEMNISTIKICILVTLNSLMSVMKMIVEFVTQDMISKDIKLQRRGWDVILFDIFLIMIILMSARQLMKNFNIL